MEREFKDMKECFQIRPIDESGEKCIITIGNHLATEEVFKSRKAAEMRINKTDWNLVSAFFFGMKEAIEYEKKLKEQKDGGINYDTKEKHW